MKTGADAAKMSPERAMKRLRQLAREERAATADGDIETLCRIAELLPAAVEVLEDVWLPERAALRAAIAEIQVAQATAEACLAAGMDAVQERLKMIAAARRVVKVYSRRGGAPHPRLNKQG